jgi:hypothetical protein
MDAHVMIAEPAADVLALNASHGLDREALRTGIVRLLTVLLILVGLVMTFKIFTILGFAVYGLPRASFQRRPEVSTDAA